MKDSFEDIFSDAYEELKSNAGKHDESSLSMAEYEELRLLLHSAKAAFAHENDDIMPDPAIKKNLRAMVAARKTQSKRFEWPSINLLRVLTFPVPAYQVGLAAVFMLAAI